MELIKNKAMVELEFCDQTVAIASNEVETTPVKVKITKSQECDFVLVGENIQYKVLIENECGGDLRDLVFKDEIDPCTEYVHGSFRVGEDHKEPQIIEGVITYEIEELPSCESIEISFEVRATESCCRGCTPPDPDRSAEPTVGPIFPFALSVGGTGVTGSTIFVKFPDGTIKETTVAYGVWGVLTSPIVLRLYDVVEVWQVEPGKQPSDVVSRTVRIV